MVTLFVPNLQWLAPNKNNDEERKKRNGIPYTVEDGQETGLEGVFEHFFRKVRISKI